MIYGSKQSEEIIRRLIVYKKYQDDPYWKETTSHEEEMGWHIYGRKPKKLLEITRPREDSAIRDYRLESYQPTTMSTAEKGLSIMSIIWNPRLSSIKPKENDKSKAFYKYMMEDFPKFNSVVRYMATVFSKKAVGDPNAWAVIVPNNPQAAPTERLQPNIQLYSAGKMVFFDNETYLFKIKEVIEGRSWEFLWVDKNVVMKIQVTVEPTNYISDVIWAYPHNRGEFPCKLLEGKPAVSEEDENVVFYRSWFYPAVPFWNKAINADSDLDAAFLNHMHPQRVEIAEDCDYTNAGVRCEAGQIQVRGAGKKSHTIQCPSCKGTGKKRNQGPHGVMYVNREKLNPDAPTADQSVYYVTVPHEPTKMLDERVDKLLEKGLHALNMDIVNKIGENQSGIAKEQDRTELKSFLQMVSDVNWDNLDWIFDWSAYYMYSSDTRGWEEEVMPEINRPSDFDINSLNEMFAQLKEANDTSMNASYRKAKQLAIQNKEFSSHPDLQKRLNVIVKLDPLPQAPQVDIDAMLMSGATTKIAAIIHCNLDAFVTRATEENKDFLDWEYKKQTELLTKFAEEMDEENQVQLDLNAIENGNTGNAGGKPGSGNNGSGGNVRKDGSEDPDDDLGGGKPGPSKAGAGK